VILENLGFGANPYLQSTIDAALGDTVRAFNMGVSPSIRSSMVRSGSFGNSGLEQMSGEAERQLQQNLGRQANEMRFNDFWTNQNFGRTLFQDAQTNNLNNASFGMGLLGTLNQFNQQDLNNANQVQNTPMNYWQQFSNQANAIGQGFGTQQSNMNMQGSPLMGALGGWQLGSQFGKAFGSSPNWSGGTQSDWGQNWGAAMNSGGAYG
jgi:hypothetical protein